MKTFQRFITTSIYCFFCTTVSAQTVHNTLPLWQRGVSYEVALQELYSTHANFFHGVDAGAGYRFSPKFKLGVGVEYSFNHFHDDNAWRLYKLRFLPIYIDQQISLRQKGNLRPYARLRQGITPTTYIKEETETGRHPYRVIEAGLYLSGCFGATYLLSPRMGIFTESGLKGFQMSFNNLDVNPHGYYLRVGLQLAR